MVNSFQSISPQKYSTQIGLEAKKKIKIEGEAQKIALAKKVTISKKSTIFVLSL